MTASQTQEGRITDEALARCRRRIGVPVRTRVRPHNEVASADAIRHFAHGIGDDNPLYCDPGYAATGPWGEVIAPPMFAMSMGSPAPVQWTDAQREAMSGGDPLAGVGQYLCGERWLLLRPIRPGDTLVKSTALHDVQVKDSEFGGGRGALLSHRHVYRDQHGAPVVVNDRDFFHAERTATARRGKYAAIEPARYTAEQLAEIDAGYADEQVRGAEPRYVEDVRVGDSLGTLVKGPLTVTDVISYHIGWGWGMFGVGALKLGYRNRQRIPGFYPPNEFGVPEAAQRCHWENEWARRLGQPAAYDYASMRMNWFAHLVTNWAGDAGWLWRFSGRTTKFNYLGDTHWLTGTVAAVRDGRTGGTGEVDVVLQGVNQRGTQTCDATATVLLPSRTHPAVRIPSPRPEDVAHATGPHAGHDTRDAP